MYWMFITFCQSQAGAAHVAKYTLVLVLVMPVGIAEPPGFAKLRAAFKKVQSRVHWHLDLDCPIGCITPESIRSIKEPLQSKAPN